MINQTETAPEAPDAPDAPAVPLRRHRTFRLLFLAAAGSGLGTEVSVIAIPLVAVTALRASPGQVGLLATFGTVAFLLVGLPAGAWVDLLRRRRLMIVADVARALLTASVPVAWWLGVLSLPQLYAVVLVAGVATVFFDVAAQSYLPQAVGRAALPGANSALMSVNAVGNIAGRGVGGLLVAVMSAPAAVVIDAVSYLWSAACLLRIGQPEPRVRPASGSGLMSGAPTSSEPAAALSECPSSTGRDALRRGGERRRLYGDIRAGVAYVFGHPVLRPTLLAGAVTNMSTQITLTVLPLLFTRELGLSGGVLGLYLAVGGAGVLTGSMFARRVAQRLGYGPTIWIAGMTIAPAGFALPLTTSGAGLWVAGAAWFVLTCKVGIDNVILVTFRQRSTPDDLLGRVTATARVVLSGALAVGAALAAVIGQYIGIRAALWLAAGLTATVWLFTYFSPLRTMRDLP